MTASEKDSALLKVVALLTDVPEHSLSRGQVGTIVEELDAITALVEFADNEGRPYAIIPCDRSHLLVLHYAEAA